MTHAEEPRFGSLDKYQRLAAVGRGGMADVSLVVARGPAGFSKLLAIKELKADLCDDPEFVTMFLDEARLAARLNHPNVVQTYEVGLDDERPRIVMEWLEGQPLHVVLGQKRVAVPLATHVFVLTGVLAALEYAHGFRDYDGTPLEVVHRDVSPHNVFVGYDGVVKLMDFGIAKVSGAKGHTQVGVVKGKVGYVAPEQIKGETIDRRADIFAVGVMLYEALVGRRLSAGESRSVAFTKRLQGAYEPVLDLAPEAPGELVTVVDRAMSLSPDDRYPSAEAMRADLERWLVNQGTSGRDVITLMAEAFAEQRRHVHKLIEQQMRALREAAGSAGVVFDPFLPSAEMSASYHASSSGGQGSRGRSGSLAAPTLVTPPLLETHTATSPMTQAMPFLDVQAKAPTRGRWRAFGGTAALALGALCLWAARRPAPTSPPPAGIDLAMRAPLEIPPAPPPAVAAAEVTPTEVEVHVKSQPPGAKVFFDGQLVGQSPLTRRVARDGEVHSVRVTSSGFRDEERSIPYSRDYAVEFALKPQQVRAVHVVGPKAPDENAPDRLKPSVPDRLKQPARGLRIIEEANPY